MRVFGLCFVCLSIAQRVVGLEDNKSTVSRSHDTRSKQQRRTELQSSQVLARILLASHSVSSRDRVSVIPGRVSATRRHRAAFLRGGSSSEDEQSIPGLRFLGDAKLMQVQPPVPESEIGSDAIQEMISVLRIAMGHYGGIGIAAPQIGFWTRVFVFGISGTNARYPAADEIPFQVWINPHITWSSTELNWMWEGCLSVPGLRGWVGRPRAVRLCGFDEYGNKKEVDLEGLAARIAQHELDHLDGILFPHRTPGTEFIVPQASIDVQQKWADAWPSIGARATSRGQLSDEM